MQLMDGTASQMGVRNVFDPEENVFAGVRYFRELLDRYDGDMDRALAAYNAGPGRVEAAGGIPPFDETQDNVADVMRTYRNYRLSAAAGEQTDGDDKGDVL